MKSCKLSLGLFLVKEANHSGPRTEILLENTLEHVRFSLVESMS